MAYLIPCEEGYDNMSPNLELFNIVHAIITFFFTLGPAYLGATNPTFRANMLVVFLITYQIIAFCKRIAGGVFDHLPDHCVL
jgi:hypothetical protein